MKKLIAMALALVTVLSMTACGAKSEENETVSNGTKATQATESKEQIPTVVNTTEPIIETTEPVTETTESKYETVNFYSIEDEVFDKLDNMTSYTIICNFEGNVPKSVYDADTIVPVKASYIYDVTEQAAHLTSEYEEVGSGNKIFYEDYKTVELGSTDYINLANEEDVIEDDYILSTFRKVNDVWTVTKSPAWFNCRSPLDPTNSTRWSDYRCGYGTTDNVLKYVNFEIGALATCTAQKFGYLSGDAQRNDNGDYIFTKDCESNWIASGCIQTTPIENVCNIVVSNDIFYDFHDWSDDDTITYTFDKDYNIKSIEFDINAKSSNISGHCVMNFEVNNNPVINVPSV